MSRYLDEMRRHEWMSAAELKALQRDALRRILAHASATVPFYRDSFRASGFSDAPTADDLQRIPFTSKASLQESFDALQSEKAPRRVTRKTTGGSTGQAVTLLKGRDSLAREMAATWLAYGWFGVSIGDPSARFWGSPTTTRRWLRATAVALVANRVNFSAFSFTDVELEAYWQRCLRFRPAFFYGYVSMLEAFAYYVRKRGYDGKRLNLKVIITTSEVLGEPQRKLLAEVFGAPVQNEYGCGEVGPIAYQCDRGLLHVVAENLVAELIREDGNPAEVGEAGEIVVTDLHNYAMPLIRYRLGDFAVRGPAACECGRSWPTFERVWGRAYDFVSSPDGRRYHGEYVMYLFEDLREQGVAVKQFQLIQTAPASVTIRVILDEEKAGSDTDKIKREMELRLPGIIATVECVDVIDRARSGKMRIIINEVAGAGELNQMSSRKLPHQPGFTL